MERANLPNLNNLKEISNPINLGNDRFICVLFKDPNIAEIIYDKLLKQGYLTEDITLVMSENTRETYFPNTNKDVTTTDLGNKALEGLGVGATLGGSVGAVAAALATVGTSVVVPVLGLLVSGSLAASFADASAGAAAGSLIGALVGSGIPNEQAELLEERVKEGGIVIAIEASSSENRDTIVKQWYEILQKEIFK